MKYFLKINRFTIVLAVILFLSISSGCELLNIFNVSETIDDSLDYNDSTDEDFIIEDPRAVSTYFWPWIHYGRLVLSSNELISGPDLFESDQGFINFFTENYYYNGKLVWIVEESDIYELEWVHLSFDVYYYENNEFAYDIYFDIEIDIRQSEIDPGSGHGIHRFTVDILEQQRGFVLEITEIILGSNQESRVSGITIDYIALDVEMKIDVQP